MDLKTIVRSIPGWPLEGRQRIPDFDIFAIMEFDGEYVPALQPLRDNEFLCPDIFFACSSSFPHSSGVG
jgi:hypothetical protein